MFVLPKKFCEGCGVRLTLVPIPHQCNNLRRYCAGCGNSPGKCYCNVPKGMRRDSAHSNLWHFTIRERQHSTR